jgi:hypothetical protein
VGVKGGIVAFFVRVEGIELRAMQRISVALVILATLAACGYGFRDRGASAPPGVSTIAIPVFGNKTNESGIGMILTRDAQYEFTRSKALRLVEKEHADAVLSGTVESIKEMTLSHTARYSAGERLVIIKLKSVLMRRDGRVLWSDTLMDREAYRVVSSSDSNVDLEVKSATEANRMAAIRIMSKRFAEAMINRTLDRF